MKPIDIDLDLGSTKRIIGKSALSNISVGHSKMKFAWVFKPPFTVWQCDSAGAARKFLTTVRKQILDKDPKLDRVSAFFTLTSPPCIGADMEKHAAGRGCSPILRTQLTAYQLLDMPSCTSEHILRPSQ